MYEFYSTCPAGLETAAARLLRVYERGAANIQTLGGAVTYRLPGPGPSACAAFQNTYLALDRTRAADARAAGVRFAGNERALALADDMMHTYGFRSFRVMFSSENTLCAPDAGARERIEHAIRSARVDREGADTEILVLKRSEGEAWLLLRLTRCASERKGLAKGALSPSVCACLIALSRPKPDGVFLDPFAGSGALPRMRDKLCASARIIAGDLAPESLSRALSGVSNARVWEKDALDMRSWLPRGIATELVTDPPWGLYAQMSMDADEFHAKMLDSFDWACAPGAHVTVLTAAKDSFSRALAAHPQFILKEKFDCLINGKKACAYNMDKNREERT